MRGTKLVVGFALLATLKGMLVAEDHFVLSFGDGGLKGYEVVDNTCFSYTLKQEDEKSVAKTLNSALATSMVSARQNYSKKADGFINIVAHWSPMNGYILYQMCGDIIKIEKPKK